MAQIETRTPVEPVAGPREGGYLGAFLSIGNLAQIRSAWGAEVAQAVLTEVSAALGELVEQPGQQVKDVGDDCFLIWLAKSGARVLEDLVVRISSRPLVVQDHRLAVCVQTGWVDLHAEQARELTPEEIDYVLFAAASQVDATPTPVHGARFDSDMEIAAQVIEALDCNRIDCQWQGISGLYADEDFLYWRGVAQPDVPELGLSFVQAQAFVPSLERLNLTRALDRHMALRVLGQLISMPTLRLASRISSLSIQNDHYWQHLLATLAAHPAAARRFTLEISGQLPLPSREAARAFCSAVRGLGAHIALANFGCGPVNLADLQACQPRTVLLDESFALRCRNDALEKVALRDMIRMCSQLAEQVVVTGVNDEMGHTDALRAGARWICGHYLNPAPPFGSKFWRSRSHVPRATFSVCGPRPAFSAPQGLASREDSSRLLDLDWRSACAASVGSYAQ